ncbi:hypothetical protein ZWY2020_014010 [Hordeum vulgare]|nr:hypothetical protein ZWY2020_014010 [Hordeum vulgare]
MPRRLDMMWELADGMGWAPRVSSLLLALTMADKAPLLDYLGVLEARNGAALACLLGWSRGAASEHGGNIAAGAGSEEQGRGGACRCLQVQVPPTDEEIITCYLLRKFLDPSFVSRAVGEVDLNSCEPRDLPGKANMGEKEWYFFVHKDLKYPTGSRANRATKEGYWKATGKDREIFKPRARELVGMKKTLVFYTGRAPAAPSLNGSCTSSASKERRMGRVQGVQQEGGGQGGEDADVDASTPPSRRPTPARSSTPARALETSPTPCSRSTRSTSPTPTVHKQPAAGRDDHHHQHQR